MRYCEERRLPAQAALNSIYTVKKGTSTSRKYAKESSFAANPWFLDLPRSCRINYDINLGEYQHARMSDKFDFFPDNRGEDIAPVRRYLVANREMTTDGHKIAARTKRSICDPVYSAGVKIFI